MSGANGAGQSGEGRRSKESGRFFEKKLRKKLLNVFTRAVETSPGRKQTKVFWFFFSKKNCFLPIFSARTYVWTLAYRELTTTQKS